MLLLAIDFDNLHQILQNLYVEMMPLCSKMTGVARGLAGLGALFYVAYRVWQALARAEPVDVFPLLRPFALGLNIRRFFRTHSEIHPRQILHDSGRSHRLHRHAHWHDDCNNTRCYRMRYMAACKQKKFQKNVDKKLG